MVTKTEAAREFGASRPKVAEKRSVCLVARYEHSLIEFAAVEFWHTIGV